MAFFSVVLCLFLKICLSIITLDEHLIKLWNCKILIANFCLLFAGYPYFEMIGINNPLWYVCVLIQCYVLYYFIEWILTKFKFTDIERFRFIVYVALLMICMGLYYMGILNEASFRGCISFSIGILLCSIDRLLKNRICINRKSKRWFGIILVSIIISCSGLVIIGLNQRWVLQFFLFPILVLSVANTNFPRVKIISELGDISFDLYILHYPLMVLVQLVSTIACFNMNHSYITMCVFLLFSWVIAWLIWKYLDLPIRRLVRRFEKKYED